MRGGRRDPADRCVGAMSKGRRRARAPARALRLLPLLIGVLGASVCGGGAAAAQDIGVRARVDRDSVVEGGQVALTVEVSGTSLGEVAPPDVSGITDFDIVGGPMSSNRFQWINGRTSATRSYTYLLRPRRTGSQRIPPLGLLVNGQTYRTESIDVEVIPGGGAMRLAWNPSPEDDVALYAIYRAVGDGELIRIGTTQTPTTVFVDRDVSAGTRYRYAVTAIDRARNANESPRSNVVTVTAE